jgi:hypothetical protein
VLGASGDNSPSFARLLTDPFTSSIRVRMCCCAQSLQGGGPVAVAAHNQDRHLPGCDPWGTTASQNSCRVPRSRQRPTIHLVVWSYSYFYVIWIWSTACASSLASCQPARDCFLYYRAHRGNFAGRYLGFEPSGLQPPNHEGTPGSTSEGTMPIA